MPRSGLGVPSMRDFPVYLVIASVWAYWIGIGAMLVRVRRRRHKLVGVVPEQRRERFMWLAWVPLAVLWIASPWWAATRTSGVRALPDFARANALYVALRDLAAVVAVIALAMTIRCWLRMGDDWRMDASARNTTLITDGPYASIRHPIYAFSMLLLVCSLIVVPTWPMAAVAALLLLLWNLKARNEEAHMKRLHGDDYARYMQRTGRFVPRLFARHH